MATRFAYWMATVGITAVLASGATAFAQRSRPNDQGEPRILAGPDVGFRVDGTDPRNGRPTGTLMVRIDGRWVETSAVPTMQLAR